MSLIYFSNLYDALKNDMHTEHELGYANSKTVYISFHLALLPIVSKSANNAFWTIPNISIKLKTSAF